MKKNEYNHLKIEKKWQNEWEKKKLYKTNDNSKKKKYYVLDMFPYPSGEGLHVGHPKGYIATDIISRMKRMEGFNVLHPMGFDAFGLPAENYALKMKTNPAISVSQNVARFKKQLEIIGLDYDWSREVNTTDPKFYKWTEWIFLKLFEKGLAYQSYEPINWCPSCKTGLANEDLEDGKCERCSSEIEQKPMRQWVLRITDYAERLLEDINQLDWPESIKVSQRNWIGKSEGSEIRFRLKNNEEDKSQPQKILIGTRNEAKFRMVRECLPPLSGFEFISLNDIPFIDDSSLVEGMDYVANAKMKAEFYYKKTGIPTISTDNVFWLEKWDKDNGIMLHMRKEANPKSDKATDEEVIAFLKSWVKKVGGRSRAHFIYAVAFASSNEIDCFVSKQRDYILQQKQSNNFWSGFPTESLLIDVKTKEYKGDQKNSIRYDVLISDLSKYNQKWFTEKTTLTSIKVFTTRADTLFGATYVVLAPEHKLVQELKSKIKNLEEVEKYIKNTKKETTIERTAEGREKTGIELKGIKVINPANNEEVSVWIADYVLADYGTGAIMAVPAHDERDFEFAKKYNLPIKQVIMPINLDVKNPPRPDKKYTERKVVHVILRNPKDKTILIEFLKGEEWGNFKPRTFIIGGIEEGESKIETSIREIKEETGYKNVKFIEEIPFEVQAEFFAAHKDVNRKVHTTGMVFDILNEEHDEISKEEKKLHELKWIPETEVSNILSIPDDQTIWKYYKASFAFIEDGVVIKSGNFNNLTSLEARKEITKFVGGKIVTKYKLRDWVFSRQRYWGEPIPLLHDGDKIIPVNEKDLPVLLPKVKSYEPTGTGESPLASISKWVNVKVGKGKNTKILKRETNTMPQWAGSSWYYLRYMDPTNSKALVDKKKEKYWNQVDFYVGGAEHATRHLIYARFWHKFLYDLGVVSTKEPFKKLQSVGLIMGEDGRKMSKRFGNVVNPDGIVKTYGADTLRLYEMFMGPFDQKVCWSTQSIIGSRRFLEKVWRIGEKIITTQIKTNSRRFTSKRAQASTDNLSLSASFQTLLHKTIKKITEDIESMSFNTAVSSMMVLVNEMEKKDINKKDFEMFLQILAPFAPHLTEELWSLFGNKKSIHLSNWPKWDKKKIVEDKIKIAIQINGKVRSEIMIGKEMTEEEIRKISLENKDILPWISGKEIKRFIYVPGRVINIVI